MNINPLINTYPASSKQKFRGQQHRDNYEGYRQRKLDYSQKIDKWDYRHSKPHTSLQCMSLSHSEVYGIIWRYVMLPCFVTAFTSLALYKSMKPSSLKTFLDKVSGVSVILPAIISPIVFFYKFGKTQDKNLRKCGFKK